MLSAVTPLQHSVWHSKRSRRCDEEVDRRKPLGVVAKKCPPVLRSWQSMSSYVLGHGLLADIDSKFE